MGLEFSLKISVAREREQHASSSVGEIRREIHFARKIFKNSFVFVFFSDGATPSHVFNDLPRAREIINPLPTGDPATRQEGRGGGRRAESERGRRLSSVSGRVAGPSASRP